MPSSEEVGSRPKLSPRLAVVAVCFAAIVFDGYDLIVYGAVVPALLEHPEWTLTPQQAGMIGSYALIGMFLGAVAVGAVTDRIGRRRTLIGCLVWFSVATLLVAVAPSPELLGALRFLAGLGFGGVVPTAITLTVEWAPERHRSFYNALMLTGFPVGGVLAAVLAVWLLPEYGFRVLFALGGVPLVTVVPLALRFLPESPGFATLRERRARQGGARPGTPPQEAPRARITSGRALAAIVLFALANFCSMLLVYGLNTWLPELMRGAGYALGPAMAFLLVLNFGAVVGGLVGSSVADRFGSRAATTGAFVVAAASILALGLPLPTAVLYLLVAIAGAATIGTQMMLFGYVALSFPTANRATALGHTTGVGRLGGVCGPLLGGYIVALQLGLGWNFGIFAAIAVAAAMLTLVVPAPDRSGAVGEGTDEPGTPAVHDHGGPSPSESVPS
ncbi:aromatic acid/H+ symport family MFS transporter [Thermobifida halotolerans]|uniref:Aromatic acid/H+ symport family MFS transporter n=1 Tax=Thermobifida halotolerans TaxID=483545 RepID=A0AA97LV87_9ACTN|nr:aromatic acid/H+ symport family MFS transporter [Thermobifida halotolerans]UOE18650.1 aromatic acid/H+ symport family MFS transporter [Thermobifida halotolerans]